jgi:DMSO/TMAO reductase YedYZ molybdopterin-dependent catalytic subunit
MTNQRRMSRRLFIGSAAAASTGLVLAGCIPNQTDPPTYGNVLRMGDLLTYKIHRLLLPSHKLAREYSYRDITSVPAIGTTNPGDPHKSAFNKEFGPVYDRLLSGGFSDWRLIVEGSVARPRAFSLDDLKRLPARTQITRHTCEEGWTAISEWTGVPLSSVLHAVGTRSTARYVQFCAYDSWVDCIDMLDALHPQTILAYGMNGDDLPISHGAPLRARVETQLGYKSMKFLRRILVTDRFDTSGNGNGGQGNVLKGYAWYAGI